LAALTAPRSSTATTPSEIPLPDQLGQVGRLQTEGPAPEQPDQQQTPGHAEQEGHAEEGGSALQQSPEGDGDAVGVEADADLSDHAPRVVAERDLAAGGQAQGPAFHAGDLATTEHGVGTRAHPLADPGGVGVGQADALVVGDHDEQRAGRLLHGQGPGLHVRTVPCQDLVGQSGLCCDAAGDGEGALLELLLEARLHSPGDDRETQGHHGDEHGELQQEQLPGEGQRPPEARARTGRPGRGRPPRNC
jgi:hypothetical protein